MAKGRKTKLTRKMIEPICRCVKLRMSQKQIADSIGIDPKTFRNWRDRGNREEKGIYRELVNAMDQAEAEMYEECVKVLREGIMGGGTQTIKKATLQNGIPVKTEITEKTQLPNPKLALEVLARMYPETWGRYETLRVEADIRVVLEELGLDYEEVMQSLTQIIESAMDAVPVEINALPAVQESELD